MNELSLCLQAIYEAMRRMVFLDEINPKIEMWLMSLIALSGEIGLVLSGMAI